MGFIFSYMLCLHRSLDARRCPRPGRTRRLDGHQLTPPPRMTVRERLRQNISAAFYRHGLLCASYPVPIILFTSASILTCWWVRHHSWDWEVLRVRFEIIRDTVTTRPQLWWPMSMLKYFMFFCGSGKAAYLYKSVWLGCFWVWKGERGQWKKEAGLWSVVLHSLIQKQDLSKRTVCSTNTKVEHWAGEKVFLMPSLLTSVSKMWIKSLKLWIKDKIHVEKSECVNISLREQPSVSSCLEEQN